MRKEDMRTEASINNFFVYNPLLSGGKEENESEKNVFYHPSTDPANVQSRNIGFVEAIVQFTDSFKPSKRVHTLQCKKNHQYYFEPEENYWMVLTVNLPTITESKDGNEIVEYLEELQENILHPFLIQIYERFKFLHGTFSSVNINTLRQKLTTFTPMILRFVDFSKLNILSILGGVRFLPLPKQPFLIIQTFLNALQSKFPSVKHTCFYYDDYIIATGVVINNLQNLNRYLMESVIETRIKDGEMGKKIFSAAYQGKFIKDLPNIFFNNDTKYNLVIYNVLKTYLVLLTTDFSLNTSFTREIELFIGPELVKLNSMIFEYRSKQTSSATARIIYFNNLNLAYINSMMNSDCELEKTQLNEAIKLIADIKKKQEIEKSGEMILKTVSGFCVTGKKSNSRELYVFLNNKQPTLIDINDEMKKILENELKGIYF